MEAGLLKWAEECVDLLGWLRKADQDMKNTVISLFIITKVKF